MNNLSTLHCVGEKYLLYVQAVILSSEGGDPAQRYPVCKMASTGSRNLRPRRLYEALHDLGHVEPLCRLAPFHLR